LVNYLEVALFCPCSEEASKVIGHWSEISLQTELGAASHEVFLILLAVNSSIFGAGPLIKQGFVDLGVL